MKFSHKVVVLSGFFAAVAVSWYLLGSAYSKPSKEQVAINEKKASTLINATMLFAEHHQETYPDADRWEEELRPYLPEGFSVTLVGKAQTRFAMNQTFSKCKMSEMPSTASQAVLFFESTASGPSANDELKSLPTKGDVLVVAYVPGHVYTHPVSWVSALKDPTFRKRVVGK